jgi:FkbM family methyltransferase|tara:strand:- start:834 stop:1529 length:696 start_codon:yes stop_codon:yes gene_type:complete
MKEIPEHCDKLYIDIGLSVEAVQTSNWLTHDKNAFCIGFEASPEATRRIWAAKESDQRKLRKENHNRFHIETVALSNPSEPTTAIFYRPNIDIGCGSLLKPRDNNNPPFKGIKESYEVKVISLQHFFNENKWLMDRFKRVEYMKIDAQGADLNILKGSSSFIKDNIVWVTAEGDGGYYHEECSNEDKCVRNNIVKFMTELGFVYYDHPKTVDATFYNPKFSDYMNVYINQY